MRTKLLLFSPCLSDCLYMVANAHECSPSVRNRCVLTAKYMRGKGHVTLLDKSLDMSNLSFHQRKWNSVTMRRTIWKMSLTDLLDFSHSLILLKKWCDQGCIYNETNKTEIKVVIFSLFFKYFISVEYFLRITIHFLLIAVVFRLPLFKHTFSILQNW